MTTKYEALKARWANMKEKGAEQLGYALGAAEVAATAFGFGFMRGKMGDADGNLDVMGMPASLVAGVAMHGLGFMGVFGKHQEHAHNLANGALAEYCVVQGARMGAARSDFNGQRRIAGRSGARPGLNQGRVGFTRANIQNPFAARAAA